MSERARDLTEATIGIEGITDLIKTIQYAGEGHTAVVVRLVPVTVLS
jgi:hypothetical protein